MNVKMDPMYSQDPVLQRVITLLDRRATRLNNLSMAMEAAWAQLTTFAANVIPHAHTNDANDSVPTVGL